jgi:hypothetical protein
MRLRRSGALREPGSARNRWLLAASVGAAIAILVLAVVVRPSSLGPLILFGKPSSDASDPPVANATGVGFDAPKCAAMVSNATLVQSIVHLYLGNGNTSGSGSGLIQQGPPGIGAYPSESTAESNVIIGWLTVCESSAYHDLVQQWGAPDYPFNALAQNGSGIYEFVIALTWEAPTTDCAGNLNSSGPCMGTAEWLINVASGAVSGPQTSFWEPQVAM